MWKYFKWSTWRRLYFKVVKNEGTPESLAMGLAIGVFTGFLIPTGGQVIAALALAYLMKSNKILAAMGTFITNPYTATVSVPAQCWIGAIILGRPLTFAELSNRFGCLMAEPSWANFLELGEDLIIPLLLGGAVFAVVFSIPTYYLTLFWVKSHRRRKAAKQLKRSQAASDRANAADGSIQEQP